MLLEPILGNHGLWAALMILMLLRGATLGRGLNRLSVDSP
jgi:hypothetical protein